MKRHREGYIVAPCLALSLLLIGRSANAIVIRHDVPDARYLVSPQSLPALVDLPFEGHGTLIASHWVVTAAHAVNFMKSHAEARYVTINGKRRDVAKIILYPDYEVSSEAWKKLFDQLKSGDAVAWKQRYDDAMASMHDIALLELKEPVEDVSPIALYRGSAESGQVVEIYGAGATGTDVSGAPDTADHRGALRRAENRITHASGPWIRYVFDCDPSALPLEGAIAGGDSGGPLLIKAHGQWVLLGITHGLDGSLDDVRHARNGDLRQGVCGQTFASTRVSFYARWIDETIHGPHSLSLREVFTPPRSAAGIRFQRHSLGRWSGGRVDVSRQGSRGYAPRRGRTVSARMLGRCVLLLALGQGSLSHAELVPEVGTVDARVRVAAYEDRQVYRVQAQVGYALDIQFEADEHFLGLATGDLEGLDFSAQGAHLFIKPKAAPLTTNLTVLTDRRVYRFDYAVALATDAEANARVVYALRFEYPKPAGAATNADGRKPSGAQSGSGELGDMPPRSGRSRYGFCGAWEVMPIAASDDGVRTTLVFGPQQSLPAVFARERDGTEALVNFTVRGTAVILHRVSEHWVLRRGRAVGCLRGPAPGTASSGSPDGSPGPADGGSQEVRTGAAELRPQELPSAGHAPAQPAGPAAPQVPPAEHAAPQVPP